MSMRKENSSLGNRDKLIGRSKELGTISGKISVHVTVVGGGVTVGCGTSLFFGLDGGFGFLDEGVVLSAMITFAFLILYILLLYFCMPISETWAQKSFTVSSQLRHDADILFDRSVKLRQSCIKWRNG